MNFFDHALEIIFPPKCGICGKTGETPSGGRTDQRNLRL